MISTFVDRFMANKPQLESVLTKKHPDSYRDLVEAVVEIITSDDYNDIDPKRIHEIDDGDYQGTLVFIIAAKGYQPSKYWSVFVDYGSCSGCDTLEAIHQYTEGPPTKDQVNDYMMLALHIVQNLKQMNED